MAVDPALLAAIDARSRAGEDDNWGAAAVDDAMAAYGAACRAGAGAAALAAMVPLGGLARAAAAEAAALARNDPAAPGLEARCWAHTAELGTLITLFADPTAAPSQSATQREYAALCAALAALQREAHDAQSLWRFLRVSRAVARGRPPPRGRPRTPIVDNGEHYQLQRRR
jgi:hypothetical protein